MTQGVVGTDIGERTREKLLFSFSHYHGDMSTGVARSELFKKKLAICFCFASFTSLKHGQQIYILRTSSWARGIAQRQSSCLVFIHLESFLESVSPYGHHSVRHYLYWVWWITPLIPALRRQRREHCPKFNDRLVYTERSRLGYSVRPCLKQNQRTKRTKTIKEFGGQHDEFPAPLFLKRKNCRVLCLRKHGFCTS